MAGNPSKPRSPVIDYLRGRSGVSVAVLGDVLFSHCLNPRQAAAAAVSRLHREGKVERRESPALRGQTRFIYFAPGEAPQEAAPAKRPSPADPQPDRPGRGAFIAVAGAWGVSVSGGPARG